MQAVAELRYSLASPDIFDLMASKLVLVTIRFFSVLPLWVARATGAFVGWAAWLCNTRAAKVTRVNLQHCFSGLSEDDLRMLCRQSMQEWGKMLFEAPVVWGHPPEWLEQKIVAIEGLGVLDQFRRQQRGVVVIAPHIGNWEVVGLFLSKYCQITSMFSPSGHNQLDTWIQASRESAGGKLVPADNRGVIRLLKTLKEQGVIGILPDQVPAEESGGFAPFYGKPALTMTLIHNLLKRTNAGAVFCCAERVRGGFKLVCKAAPEGLYSEDEAESLQALNQGVEACVNDCLNQYQWEYKRFRKQPTGTPKLYTKENT